MQLHSFARESKHEKPLRQAASVQIRTDMLRLCWPHDEALNSLGKQGLFTVRYRHDRFPAYSETVGFPQDTGAALFLIRVALSLI